MRIPPSTTLREIRMMIEAEIVAQPVDATMTFSRRHMVVVHAALAALEDDVAALEEARAAADRLNRELATMRADAERARLQQIARDVLAARLPGSARGGNIVDLTEVLRREMRDTGRPGGPEGGAA